MGERKVSNDEERILPEVIDRDRGATFDCVTCHKQMAQRPDWLRAQLRAMGASQDDEIVEPWETI